MALWSYPCTSELLLVGQNSLRRRQIQQYADLIFLAVIYESLYPLPQLPYEQNKKVYMIFSAGQLLGTV